MEPRVRLSISLSRTEVFLLALVFSLGGTIAAAWTGPTGSPPSNNVAAPINGGSASQVKNGNLGVNGLAVFGNTLLQGSSYLNFGTTAGFTGYGFRDNGGTMQYANSGGAWTTFNSSGGLQTGSTTNSSFINGILGINTANPLGTLDIENVAGAGAATLCMNGTCISSLPPNNQQLQSYTTAGTYTWTPPSNLSYIVVQVCGGGAAGGGAGYSNNYGYYSGGSGGGAGGYAESVIAASQLSAPVTVTVGAGGTGNYSPYSGNTSSFGSFLSASGGTSPGYFNYSTPSGGMGQGGQVNLQGGSGEGPTLGGAVTNPYGQYVTYGNGYGGYTPTTIYTYTSGNGGSSQCGGTGGAGGQFDAPSNNNGSPAAGNGGPGGGGGGGGGGQYQSYSGAGGAGAVIINEYLH